MGTHKSTINFTKIAKGSEASKQKKEEEKSKMKKKTLSPNVVCEYPAQFLVPWAYCGMIAERIGCMGLLNILFTIFQHSYMKNMYFVLLAFRNRWTFGFDKTAGGEGW